MIRRKTDGLELCPQGCADGREADLSTNRDLGCVKRVLYKLGLYTHTAFVIEDFEKIKAQIKVSSSQTIES